MRAVSLRYPLQMVLNLAELITSPAFGSGFVPNGGRAYYTKRSQPPLLSEMVWAVYNVSKDLSLLQCVQFTFIVSLLGTLAPATFRPVPESVVINS